jgi:phytoene desaturase (3,4-didehydrolycopene-forming)
MFEEAFKDLDTSLAGEGVKLLKCEPNYNVWFSDGQSFRLSTDVSSMKNEVEKWEGKDGFERYLGFLQEAHRHYELSVTHVLRANFPSYFSLLRAGFLRHILSLHPFESIYRRASRYFWTERLRRVFTFGSMYMGMSPFDAPGKTSTACVANPVAEDASIQERTRCSSIRSLPKAFGTLWEGFIACFKPWWMLARDWGYSIAFPPQ